MPAAFRLGGGDRGRRRVSSPGPVRPAAVVPHLPRLSPAAAAAAPPPRSGRQRGGRPDVAGTGGRFSGRGESRAGGEGSKARRLRCLGGPGSRVGLSGGAGWKITRRGHAGGRVRPWGGRAWGETGRRELRAANLGRLEGPRVRGGGAAPRLLLLRRGVLLVAVPWPGMYA